MLHYEINTRICWLKSRYSHKEWRLWANEVDDYPGACIGSRTPFHPRPLPIGRWCSTETPPLAIPEFRLLSRRAIWKLPCPPRVWRGLPFSNRTHNVGTRYRRIRWVPSPILDTAKFRNEFNNACIKMKIKIWAVSLCERTSCFLDASCRAFSWYNRSPAVMWPLFTSSIVCQNIQVNACSLRDLFTLKSHLLIAKHVALAVE